jgi:hypothetical protein
LSAEPGLGLAEPLLISALARAFNTPAERLQAAWWAQGSWGKCALLAKRAPLGNEALAVGVPIHLPNRYLPRDPSQMLVQIHQCQGEMRVFDAQGQLLPTPFTGPSLVHPALFIALIPRPMDHLPESFLTENAAICQILDVLRWQEKDYSGWSFRERWALLPTLLPTLDLPTGYTVPARTKRAGMRKS